MNNIVSISDFAETTMPPLPRKLPQQGRSRLLFDSIKEACLKILQEDGYQALTAIHLAEVAGVCVGSIYQYFPNIDAVVAAVYTDEIEQAVQETRQLRLSIASSLSLEGQLEFMIQAGVSFHQRMLTLDEAFHKRYVTTYMPTKWFNQIMNDPNAAVTELGKVLLEHKEGRGICNCEAKAFLIASANCAIFSDTVKQRPEMLWDESFTDYMLAMSLGIIFDNGKRNG